MCALKRARWLVWSAGALRLLGAGVLGDSLGAFTDSVLGQLSGEKEPDCSLDLSAGDGRSLVVVGKTRSFTGDSLKDIVHERVHDRHSFA